MENSIQFKTRERVVEHGEVLTAQREVKAMCDLVKEESERIDSRILEPACGEGPFLQEILKRKLETAISRDFETASIAALSSLFGIELLEDNAKICRDILFNIWKEAYDRYGEHRKDVEESARSIVETNIICGDALKLQHQEFDVIIGNPPYQKGLYHRFISVAIALNPHYLVMITPSRWMTKQSEGIPREWVDELLYSNHFRVIHDFEKSEDCFPGVLVTGGVSYFLYDRDYYGKCDYFYHFAKDIKVVSRNDYLDAKSAGIVIRDPQAYSIIEKITAIEGNYYLKKSDNFSGLVSPKDFYSNKKKLTSSWRGYSKKKDDVHYIKCFLNDSIHNIAFGWVKESDIPKNIETKEFHRVYIPAANNSTRRILGQPFYGEPNSVCSQTYLVIGYNSMHRLTEVQCDNIITYIRTKFFRYLVSIKKKTQNGPRSVYQFVPLQDFSKPWTDEELYRKYNLSEEEIAFIESAIRPLTSFEDVWL